jgi:hypothetical protein
MAKIQLNLRPRLGKSTMMFRCRSAVRRLQDFRPARCEPQRQPSCTSAPTLRRTTPTLRSYHTVPDNAPSRASGEVEAACRPVRRPAALSTPRHSRSATQQNAHEKLDRNMSFRYNGRIQLPRIAPAVDRRVAPKSPCVRNQRTTFTQGPIVFSCLAGQLPSDGDSGRWRDDFWNEHVLGCCGRIFPPASVREQGRRSAVIVVFFG